MGNITIIFGFFKRKIQIITKLFCLFCFIYLLFLMGCIFFFFLEKALLLFFEKQTHTQGKGKMVLTQRHTTTPLKSHGNF